jgi:hypothetical protein
VNTGYCYWIFLLFFALSFEVLAEGLDGLLADFNTKLQR